MKKIYIILLLVSFVFPNLTKAQYASKVVRKGKQQAYVDSLKRMNYDRVFPFWGAKAYKKGIDIPYPVGFMANYFYVNQGVTIDNFQLGFDNAHDGIVNFPLTPVSDSILSFGDNRNRSYSFNVRPDLWVFPFIDLYGIFGYGHSETSVEVISPLLPDGSFTSVVDQNITTYGFGVLLAGGLGPVWLSLDANMTWNKPELLDKPTIANVVGIRMGKVFKFKNRPQSNFSFWVGAMYLTMQSETVGQVPLQDAIPQEIWDKKDQWVSDYWDKYNAAPQWQQTLADKFFTPIVNAVDERNGESLVAYKMDKQTKAHWNGLIGAQYQLNKSWQFRVEGGVIGDRKSILLSINYRLLGFKKKTN